MIANRLGYKQVENTPLLVKSGPAGLYAIVAITSVTLCTIFDSTSASGDLLWEGSLTPGQVVHFGGNGLAANNGIYVTIGGSGTVNILYA